MEPELQSEEQDLEHYQLRRLLGEGGFGEVYEAWDTKLQRSIAIKRLKPKMLSSRPETLLDEARMAASLRHPAFVKIFSIDGNADQQSIIMEYVDGNTLRKMGEGEPLAESVALDIVAQVAEAMEEAHQSKLIHGDLKPSNLMLEASGKVRIMDFGLARRIDPQSTESVVLDDAQGTIAYLAPELLTGTRPNEQSDVYSLGVVLYEMVTGGRPFPHLNGLALAAAYMQSSSAIWPFPATLHPGIGMLIRAMTDRVLEKRISSMREVRQRLAAMQRGAHSEASVPGRGLRQRISSLAHRIRRGKIVALLSLLAIVAALFGYLAAPLQWRGTSIPVYSETVAMQNGMESLRTFDRDDSLDNAIKSFSLVLAHSPDHAAAAAGIARAYLLRYLGDKRDVVWLQRADAAAQRALQLNDQLAFAHAVQGGVRLAQANFSEATLYADQALRLDPLQTMAPLVKSSAALRQQKYAEAETIIAAASLLHPRSRLFTDALGVAKFTQNDYVAAEVAFRKSIQFEPDAVLPYSNLSLALQHQHRENEALQVLQQGLQIRPNSTLFQSLGTILFSRAEYVESAKAFEKAVALSGSSNYLHWANLADSLRWIPGREKDSREAYKEAIARMKPLLASTPENATLNSRMGLYSAKLGDRAGALAHSVKAIALAPKDATVRSRAVVVYELFGERSMALVQLEIAIAQKYPRNLISSEPDLIALRRDPRYLKILPERE